MEIKHKTKEETAVAVAELRQQVMHNLQGKLASGSEMILDIKVKYLFKK